MLALSAEKSSLATTILPVTLPKYTTTPDYMSALVGQSFTTKNDLQRHERAKHLALSTTAVQVGMGKKRKAEAVASPSSSTGPTPKKVLQTPHSKKHLLKSLSKALEGSQDA